MDLSGPGIDVKLKERKKERDVFKEPCPGTTRYVVRSLLLYLRGQSKSINFGQINLVNKYPTDYNGGF
jgi:hypothetical protein